MSNDSNGGVDGKVGIGNDEKYIIPIYRKIEWWIWKFVKLKYGIVKA